MAAAAIALGLAPLGALAAAHPQTTPPRFPVAQALASETPSLVPSQPSGPRDPSASPGVSFLDPHVQFSTETNLCDTCHSSHEAGTTTNLLDAASQKKVCYSCHDGTGANSNVQAQFGEQTLGSSTMTSFHPVPRDVNGYSLVCSDCHTSHQPSSQDTTELRVRIDGRFVYSPPDQPIGNRFCYSCHGANSTYPAPFGDYSAFDQSVHNTSSSIQPPKSGSGIMCLTCHEPHGSQNGGLLTDPEPQLCFDCHTQAGAAGSDASQQTSNVWKAFNATPNDYTTGPVRIYHHPVSEADQAGGTRTVECSSCHNSHLAQADGTDVLANPADTSQPFHLVWDPNSAGEDRGNITAYCEACHISPQDTQPVSPGPGVPYPVNLVQDPHDTFAASGYNRNSPHGASGADLACTACHDSHGSSNAFMLTEDPVSPDGSTTNNVTGYDGSAGEWQKLDTFCSTCHALPADHLQDGTQQPLNSYQACLDCHTHEKGL
jgi:predicted CXXCH cytochrome family protein